MSLDVNVVVLNGRIVGDVESKQIGENTVHEFALAWSTLEKGQETGNFIDCSMWGNQGVVPYLTRGKQVSVVGRLRQEKWKTKDGDNRSVHRLRVVDIQLLSGGQGQQKADADTDSIPF